MSARTCVAFALGPLPAVAASRAIQAAAVVCVECRIDGVCVWLAVCVCECGYSAARDAWPQLLACVCVCVCVKLCIGSSVFFVLCACVCVCVREVCASNMCLYCGSVPADACWITDFGVSVSACVTDSRLYVCVTACARACVPRQHACWAVPPCVCVRTPSRNVRPAATWCRPPAQDPLRCGRAAPRPPWQPSAWGARSVRPGGRCVSSPPRVAHAALFYSSNIKSVCFLTGLSCSGPCLLPFSRTATGRRSPVCVCVWRCCPATVCALLGD